MLSHLKIEKKSFYPGDGPGWSIHLMYIGYGATSVLDISFISKIQAGVTALVSAPTPRHIIYGPSQLVPDAGFFDFFFLFFYEKLHANLLLNL